MTIKKEQIETLTSKETETMKTMMDMNEIKIHSCTILARQLKRYGIASERETTRILKTLCALGRIEVHKGKFTILIPLTEEEMK